MKIAIVLVLLVILSVVFHFASPWYFTPIASNWGAIDTTIDITFWITGIVFVAVNLFLAYTVYKYRSDKTEKADYEPENKKLEIILTVITAIGVVAMLAPGLVVWDEIIDVPDDAHVVEAVGQQWQWSYRYPGADGKLGKVATELISPANPFGMDPADPAGQDDRLVSSNEMHLPLDKPVKMVLRSKDVLHNFAVPQFRVKMDLVPGSATYLWFIPTRIGTFEILCEELCGIAHFTMRGRVIVDSEEDYTTWLNAQPTYADTQNVLNGNAEKGQAMYAVCGSCHGQKGEGNAALNAPALAGMSDWYLARQVNYFKQGIRGADEADAYGRQMAPMANTLANDAIVNDVAAYIQTLEPISATKTIEGDASRGYSYYVTCGACHGKKGEGIPGLNAPGLAGQHDWYLKRQLSNFQQGIRGKHKKDLYGTQMSLMSKILQDEQAIDDIIAYINTL